MVEKQRVAERHFEYKGLFKFRELFRIMDFWLRDKFYDKKEKYTSKMETPLGIQYNLQFEPWKKVTDYYKIVLEIEMTVTALREVEVELNGEKQKVNHGKVEVKITSFLVFDYENKFEDAEKPFLYFLRHIMNFFVYKHITKKYWEMAVDEATDLENTMRSYLNTFQHKMEESYETGHEHTRYA
ncbi:hypothetical protein HYS48_04585 [Candidatus Woesearchaeota archaeon]|nr:hypothetical protein [Candidatus Woesearchaeota archaeon]